jgi:hypothetical protein
LAQHGGGGEQEGDGEGCFYGEERFVGLRAGRSSTGGSVAEVRGVVAAAESILLVFNQDQHAGLLSAGFLRIVIAGGD